MLLSEHLQHVVCILNLCSGRSCSPQCFLRSSQTPAPLRGYPSCSAQQHVCEDSQSPGLVEGNWTILIALPLVTFSSIVTEPSYRICVNVTTFHM